MISWAKKFIRQIFSKKDVKDKIQELKKKYEIFTYESKIKTFFKKNPKLLDFLLKFPEKAKKIISEFIDFEIQDEDIYFLGMISEKINKNDKERFIIGIEFELDLDKNLLYDIEEEIFEKIYLKLPNKLTEVLDISIIHPLFTK